MTMLYRLGADAAALAAHYGAEAGRDPWAGGTVAPGRFAPVVTAGREAVAGPRQPGAPRRLVPRLWGVPPPPAAADPARSVPSVHNPDSPFWIGNLRNSEFRCLVPATAAMEWGRADPATGKRRKLWLAPIDQPLFAFAGVWKDSEVPSFALLTCPANAVWRKAGHEVMPAILPADPRAWHIWLNGEWNRASALLTPYSSSLIRDLAA